MNKILKKFNMDDGKEMKIPMHPTTYLRLDKESKKVDNTPYKGIVGSLLYLTMSRPNIMFSVCLCARFQKDPREVHLTEVKRIVRYLIDTPNLGLCFKKEKDFKFISFCNVDYVGDKIERKRTRGSCYFIGGNLVIWVCKKGTITLSTLEAEYISISSCYAQLLWIKNQLEEYNIFESNVPIFCNNKAAISLFKNSSLHYRAKHVEIKHHFIRDLVQKGTLDLQFVPIEDQLVDIFTKPLTEDKLILLRNKLGMEFIRE